MCATALYCFCCWVDASNSADSMPHKSVKENYNASNEPSKFMALIFNIVRKPQNNQETSSGSELDCQKTSTGSEPASGLHQNDKYPLLFGGESEY